MLYKKTTTHTLFILFFFFSFLSAPSSQDCLVLNPFVMANTDGFTTTDVAQSFTMNCSDGLMTSISVWSFSNNTEIELLIYEGEGFHDNTPYIQEDVVLASGTPINNEIALDVPYPFVGGQVYTFRLRLKGGGTFQLAKSNLFNAYSGGNLYENELPQFTEDLFFIINTSGSLLPVELTRFEVESAGNAVQLYWETATEINNSGFEIERSNNAKDWEPISFVEGQGNRTETTNYSFEDNSPHAGWNYYRLKQIDFDGHFEYSDVRSIAFSSSGNFRVYPNPARVSQQIQVQLDEPADHPSNLFILNPTGMLLKSVPVPAGQGQQTLSFSKRLPGVYSIVLKNSSGVVISSQRLVITD